MKLTTSKLIAMWVLTLLTFSLAASFWLGYLAIMGSFNGSLPWVTAGLGVFDGVLGYVLSTVEKKAQAENTAGGITFESAKAKNYVKDL